MRKGRGFVDPRPFPALTGYALRLSRRVNWVTVSEEELGRRTSDFVGRLTEEYQSTRRGAREYLAAAAEAPAAPMVD
jgi:hypothetical protein